MKSRNFESSVFLAVLLSFNATAATLYVDLNSGNPTPPYTNCSIAATNIQDAIDAATNGDLVLVTNGIYATGGRPVNGYALTNRVVIDKALTVQSVNGPTGTVIQGYQKLGTALGGGSNAVRCAYLTNGAALVGFTLAKGATFDSGDALNEQSGGGVWCEPGGAVRKSALRGNSANADGGGACGGTLYNCELTDNSAAYGGGVYGGQLFNCTVVNNRATSRSLGAGTAVCTNYNCIVEFNNYTFLANYSQSLFYWSCTTPMPAGGLGNLTNSPNFVDLPGGILRLQCGSPCIDAGTNLSALLTDDLRGESRPVDGDGDGLAQFDMGAYERNPVDDARDIGIRTGFTNFALYFSVPFVAQIDGCASNFWWDFGDGTIVSNQFEVTHAWTSPGLYPVKLTAQFLSSANVGSATTGVDVVEATYYVNARNSTPAYPFATWATAATNIQDAVDAGSALGRLVLVTNGVYSHGGVALYGIMTNRVALTNGVRLQSVNGPEQTLIEGSTAPGGGNGDGAVRCLYVDTHSVVSGFTITNGHTLQSSMLDRHLHNGGGVWCEPDAVITNCLIINNSAGFDGGGVSGGYAGFPQYNGRVYDCRLVGNSGYHGGGAAESLLINCVLMSNYLYTAAGGGGAYWSTLYNCTVVGNSAGYAGGVESGAVFNSILYYNSGGNWGGIAPLLFQSCTSPLAPGLGNITNEPLFLDAGGGDLLLQTNSPCINSGNNSYVSSATDLDGNPRIQGGTVDIGAYEYQTPSSILSYAWAQQYGLPTDGSADYANADGDGLNNYREWIAGTDPTNSLSTLLMLTPTHGVPGINVSWESVSGKTYFLERSINLAAQTPFAALRSNLVGQAGTTTFLDTTATNAGPYFYRVGIQQ